MADTVAADGMVDERDESKTRAGELTMGNEESKRARSRPAPQVRVRLSTREDGLEMPVGVGVILVPTDLRRYALSTLVNTLLESPTPVPFEFLINGTFLRTTIEQYLTDSGISAETTLQIEYVRALLPPTYQASFQHDDWVGAVDVLSSTSPSASAASQTIQSGHERILSGSYDGRLRVWSMSSTVLATSAAPPKDSRIPAHILAAKFTTPTSIVSAGQDALLRLWSYTEPAPDSPATLTPQLTLTGHTQAVTSLSVHAPSARILSASHDTTARLWSSDPSQPTTTPLPKRRKLTAPTSAPLTTLPHAHPATSAIFAPHDQSVAYTTAGHALTTWDLTTGTPVSSRVPAPSTSLTCSVALPSLNLLAAGTYARNVALVDPREGVARSCVATLKGRGVVSCLDGEAGGAGFGVVGGGGDGCVRVWDVRSVSSGGAGSGRDAAVQATYRIGREGKAKGEEAVGGEGVKVFGVRWDGDVGIVSCGEDARVQVNRGVEAGRARM